MKAMKKHVSMPSLLKLVKASFEKVKDVESTRPRISLSDCLMSGLAIFSLKMASLLEFDENRIEERLGHNLKRLYQVEEIPCDTYLRERLDIVEPGYLRRAFSRVFTALQRAKFLERFVYYDGYYLLSLDGTGCFSSHEVHCDSCCVKTHRDGRVTYYHQVLGAVIVHPDERVVIPLAPEAILKVDGTRKNDCERNASKRLLRATRREHPHLKLIVVEDGLSSNAPHIRLLKSLEMRYILGAKPDDHTYLFEFINAVKTDHHEERDGKGTVHFYRWVNGVPLNDSNADVEVNFLDYVETTSAGDVVHFSWVTDIPLSIATLHLVMKGGRARWHIENETFNTLKNQGYHFEHNYGHGYHYLTTVFAMLMFLAFLIDQVQQMSCVLFQRALKKTKRKIRLWNKIRFLFEHFFILSWADLYEAIAQGKYGGVLQPDTS